MKKTNRRKKSNITYRMIPKSLVADRGRPFLNPELEAMTRRMLRAKLKPRPHRGFDLDLPDDEAPPKASDGRPDATTALVGANFEAAVPKEVFRKLEHGKALAVIVLVPSPAWIEPTEHYFTSTFGSRWRVRTGGSANARCDASVGSGEVSGDLSRGLCVVGVSADEKQLPAALLGAVDITIRLTSPTGEIIRTAIARFTKRPPGQVPEASAAAGLDLHDLVSAFRPGSGPAKIVDRLAAAAETVRGDVKNERLPDLKTTFEFGEARTWGLQLARDVADYRAGKLDRGAMQKGICLASEPGIGKSLYARALAHHCKLPIVVSSVADWFTQNRSFLDEVIRSMRAVFDRASALARVNGLCVLLLDECDAVPDRSTLDGKNRDYWLPLISDLLLRLDDGTSSSTRRGIILVAATNNASAVDPALLRPGRFERLVTIERPDVAGTLNMLKFHASEIAEDEFSTIATIVEPSTGAEIMAFVRTARQIARHAGHDFSAADLRAALLAKDPPAPEADWRICVHEAGHAATALAIAYGRVRHCTVGAMVGIANRTLIEPGSSADLATRPIVEDQTTVLLGGRAAERHLLGNHSAGGAGDEFSDTGLATANIASLHLSWGLGDTVTYHGSRREVLGAVRYDRSLRDVVEADLQRLQKRANDVVGRHRAAVLAIAEALLCFGME
jgi:cell division protease FtsH